jgi:CubicO group peptidase (beta-lactamase class C family)
MNLKGMAKIKLFLFLALLCNNCRAQQNDQAKQLDSIFSMLTAQNQFNGSVLIAEKGTVILEKGYGYSNETSRQYNNPQTIFELASCSKQFTAAAIVLLKRQGKLQYEDPISKYLPELGFWNNVTIYDLLRQTSGIADDYISDMPKDWDKSKIATNDDVIRFYQARKDTMRFVPGSRHEYNNNNYALLASIVERASGKQFAGFLSDNIFKPLKMKHTFVYNRRQQPRHLKNYAIGYVWAKKNFSKVTLEDPGYGDSTSYCLDGVVGAAKVNSNVEDLYKWVTALKNNTLFTQHEFDEMMAVTQTSNGKNIPYGFGFNLSKGENKFSFGHTGSWDGYVSYISQNMIKDRTIIILQNFQFGLLPFENITQILNNQPIETKYRQRTALPQTEMEKYTGVYPDEQDKEVEHVITYKDGHLFYNTRKEAWDMRFFPVSPNEFQGLLSNGGNAVLKFSVLPNGTTQLEMLQNGTRVGNGIKKE